MKRIFLLYEQLPATRQFYSKTVFLNGFFSFHYIKDISDGGTKDLVVMDDFLYDEPETNN